MFQMLRLCRRSTPAMMIRQGHRHVQTEELLPSSTPKIYKNPVLYTLGDHFPHTVTWPCGSGPRLSPTQEQSIWLSDFSLSRGHLSRWNKDLLCDLLQMAFGFVAKISNKCSPSVQGFQAYKSCEQSCPRPTFSPTAQTHRGWPPVLHTVTVTSVLDRTTISMFYTMPFAVLCRTVAPKCTAGMCCRNLGPGVTASGCSRLPYPGLHQHILQCLHPAKVILLRMYPVILQHMSVMCVACESAQ